MADYVPISAGQTNPGAPLTSALIKALEENPRAIAEGAAGAPRIEPIASMTHNGAAGAVGTYVFARRTGGTADSAFGGTTAGSSLQPTSATQRVAVFGTPAGGPELNLGTALSGTWRCMGTYDHAASASGVDLQGATLWLRIS